MPTPYLATTYGQPIPEAVLIQRAAIEKKIQSLESDKPTPPAVNIQREWTSKDRKFKTIGVLVESDYRVAKIRKSDGKTVSVSTDKLIDDDRRYIENAFAEVEVFRKNLAKWEKAKQALKSELSTVQEKKDSTANADFALPKSSRIDSQQIPQPGPEWQSEKTLAGPIANGMSEYKYVEDDLFPDIYAFHSVAQFRNYSERKRQNPNLTARERNELGIELVESKTRILIISRIPHKSATIFEFEPTTGRNKGKRLFTSSLNVYDSPRDAASQEGNVALAMAMAMIRLRDAASQETVRSLELTIKALPQPSLKWYEGGTLVNKSGSDWRAASARNKLASCADIVAAMWNRKNFVPELQSKIRSMDDMKPLAQNLADNLDAAFKPLPDPAADMELLVKQDVATFAAILLKTMGWIP